VLKDELVRVYEVELVPGARKVTLGQDAEPFHIGATLSWRWDSFHTARTVTTEEDAVAIQRVGFDRVDRHGRAVAARGVRAITVNDVKNLDISTRPVKVYACMLPNSSCP
jgi:hypothetical protein